MKKTIYNNIIILVSLIFSLLVFFEIYNFCSVKLYYKKYENTNLKYSFRMKSYEYFYNEIFKKKFMRPVENKNSSLNPVLIFGCAFAYGQNLKNDETFSHHIAEYIKNPVYNFAYGGWSIANTLYQAQHEPIIQNLSKEPEYVIYVYTPVQLHRVYLNVYDPGDNHLTAHYDYKNGIIKETKPSLFLYSFYTAKKLNNAAAMRKIWTKNYWTRNEKYRMKNEEVLIKFFDETIKELKKRWKNTKYYILAYENGRDSDMQRVSEETDWQVVFIDDIASMNVFAPEYVISKTDTHPSKKAWDVLTEPFLRRIGAL